jgi:hypothetical protein
MGRNTKEFAKGMTGAAEKVIRISSLVQAGVISHD